MSEKTVVLKFGSSVLQSAGNLHIAVDEIYRHWREGCRVLAVVSAFEDVTDILMGEIVDTVGAHCPEATAAYLATGEEQTAALLLGSLRQYGLPSRLASPREIGLVAEGLILESTPCQVDKAVLERLWQSHPILILPGFFGLDSERRTVLFGRGGSDISALFLAGSLGASCRLLKDVAGVFDTDPARNRLAHRFAALSWETAIQVSGPLIQGKALRYAHGQDLSFEVGRPNQATGTLVGHGRDDWALPRPPAEPVCIALVGCGNVGRGIYETVRRYKGAFDLRHVVVRDIERYPGVKHLTIDPSCILEDAVDVVIICIPGMSPAHSWISAALSAGKFVITANKEVVAAHGRSLTAYAGGESRRLWYSAAVGGALPALETIASLATPVREIRGIVNGTCGVVLDAWAEGKPRDDAVALAQAAGFAEVDPHRDLSGQDSADKLSLLIHGAFGKWIDPQHIPTHGIDSIDTDPTGYKLIARARRWCGPEHGAPYITACVGPERLESNSFLGASRGPENRLEIELETGEVIRLRAQGAGRWPTTVSVMGDLHEIARRVEVHRQ